VKINMKTISQITGYSQSTISNVLNNKKGTNRKTAEEILKVAKEIGYLNTPKIENIKLVFFKKSGKVLTETPLINELIDGIVSEARDNGLDTILFNIQENDDDYKEKFDSLFTDRNSGIILLATELSENDLLPFQKICCPLVVLDAWFDRFLFDTVLMNNYDSFITSTRFLIENGHTKIGFLGSQIQIKNFYYREQGFRDALEKYECSIDEDLFIYLDPTLNGSYESMKNYLESSPRKMATAYCAVNDIVALGALKAFQEYGYKIPDDISIMGFDNMPFGEISSPSLTTMNVPKRALGELAVKRLIEQSNKGNYTPCKTELLTSLIIRQSVRKL